MKLRLKAPPKGRLHARIILPPSKSVLNRLLLLDALSDTNTSIQLPLEAKDNKILAKALKNIDSNTIDIEDAGTPARFLCAFLAFKGYEGILTGSARMQERPMGELLKVLRQMGAKIDCLEKDGFLPVKFQKATLQGGSYSISGKESSQFISALLLIAPYLKGGMELKVEDDLVSASYVNITLAMMENSGVQVKKNGVTYKVQEGNYKSIKRTVEGDWSAASFWICMASLSTDCDLVLEGIGEKDVQGDKAILNYLDQLGLLVENVEGGLRFTKKEEASENKAISLKNTPDMGPAWMAWSAGKKSNSIYTHTEHLALKESNRVLAMREELKKIGVVLIDQGHRVLINCNAKLEDATPTFATHQDHRIAMALSSLAFVYEEVLIEEAEVVQKSYPMFWEDLEKAGFTVEKA